MQIWPAIDLRGGKCVRLRQGDYGQETVFGEDPVAVARRWVDEGGERLHLVDLDAARSGTSANRSVIAAIVEAVPVPCQLGGGVRDEARVREGFELGLARLVVGTQAIKDPDWFREMTRAYPGQMVLGIDARNGLVATDGWLETSELPAIELAQQFSDAPIAGIVYTDIARDGMMRGPNVTALEEMLDAVQVPVIASGGVSQLEDVTRLAQTTVSGCIVGRALYEGTLGLSDAVAVGHSKPLAEP